MMEVGTIVRVIKDFLTTTDGELCAVTGDIIQVVDVIDRHWIKCAKGEHNRQGNIPKAHVCEVEDIGLLPEGSKIYVVSCEYLSQEEGDLSLTKGALVISEDAVDEHWRKGRTLNGFEGIFPPSYCYELDPSNYINEIKAKRNKMEKFAQVVHTMHAQLPGEIDLIEGQVVKIVEIIDKDWYRGIAEDGKTGVFPSSFVRIIDSFPGERPPPEANVKPYLNAKNYKRNEYMNTRQAFSGLEEGLKSIGQEAFMKSFGLEPNFTSSVPSDASQNIFDEDEYFKLNLPSSYGSVSLTPPEEEGNDQDSVFGRETIQCSKGFQDLSEHLGALHRNRYQNESGLLGTPDYSKVSENLSLLHSSSNNSKKEEESVQRSTSLDHYRQLSESFNVFKDSQEKSDSQEAMEQEDESKSKKVIDYSKLSENLSVFSKSIDTKSSPFSRFREKKAPAPPPPTLPSNSSGSKKAKLIGDLLDDISEFRYQNVTTEATGFTGKEVGVRPYAITKFNFVAEFDCELGFSAGEMVYLNRYVDNEWLEGEIDSKRGMFPIQYVNIIVDLNGNCTDESGNEDKDSSVIKKNTQSRDIGTTVHENLEPDTFHKVLYNYHAQMEGDISVAEGEVVRVKEKQDENWVMVENSQGDSGIMPGNHLDPRAEFDGKALFDIERLLSYRSYKERSMNSHSVLVVDDGDLSRHIIAKKDELKFFDPLRSPDDEMLKIEQELENKVKEPRIIALSNNRVIINSVVKRNAVVERRNAGKAFKESKQPKDLESLISNNISKLKSNSTTNERGGNKPSFEFSQMVLEEMRGKHFERDMNKIGFNPFKDLAEKGFVHTIIEDNRWKKNNSFGPSESELVRATQKTSDPPPRPLNPPKGKPASIKKTPAPKPPKPPPPKKEKLFERAKSVSVTKKIPEALYSAVKKVSRTSTPPPRPSKPPLLPSVSIPAQPLSEEAAESKYEIDNSCSSSIITEDAEIYEYLSCPNYPPPPKPVLVQADVHIDSDNHAYDTPDDEEEEEEEENIRPDYVVSNQANVSKSVEEDDAFEPLLPARTLSLRTSVISRLDSLRSCRDNLPSFPPDKDSPGPENQEKPVPPKAGSLPVRSASVASSIKSRSTHYAHVASEHGYSPAAMSSLNHSYETLNSINGDASPNPYNSIGTGSASSPPPPPVMTIRRKPHRPAPPVPVKEQFERSKEILFKKNNTSPRVSMTAANKRNMRYRKIHSLKRQIQIKEKMLEECIALKEQLLRELDMYQEIAVAKGPMYEHLNRKMDRCQDNIEALSDELQRLQACLADEEMRLEEDGCEERRRKLQDESLRRQMQAQKEEETRKKLEEKRQKNKEKREKKIAEIVQTERDFCRDLKLTWQAFGLDTPEMLEQRALDVKTLFGNMKDIIETSERFLETLQREVREKADCSDQMIGKCFFQHSDEMRNTYTEYCLNNEKAELLLEKYEQVPDIQRIMQKGVEALQSQVPCFNIGSILIKPVQRIVQYPLLLNDLIKCTEHDHKDREDLVKALAIMGDVASFINESKRRKDIVDKYKNEEDQPLSRRISKLNLHSINKKSARMSQKILNTMGIDPMTRDYNFDELEKRFNFLSRYVQLFLVDSQRFGECLRDCVLSQFNFAENVADLYGEKANQIREVERFRGTFRSIISTFWNQYNLMLDSRVVKPLQQLLEIFQGPSRLIQKRSDKHLDFSATKQRTERNKDPMRAKSFREEMESCRTSYEALNTQLVRELPKLLEISTKIYTNAVTDFILLRKLFIGRVTKELIALMDIYKKRLPLMSNTGSDILDTFHVKHALVSNQIGRFSFSSRNLKTDDKKKSSSSGKNPTKMAPQTATTRTFLRGKYAAVKLFEAKEFHHPSGMDPLELGISPGELVGVIQQKDPLGNIERWFVDKGNIQGFVPSRVLVPICLDDRETNEALKRLKEPEVISDQDKSYHADESNTLRRQTMVNDALMIKKTDEETYEANTVVHEYDDVAEEDDNDSEEMVEQKANVAPTRKAPPIPSQTLVNKIVESEYNSKLDRDNALKENEIENQSVKEVHEKEEDKVQDESSDHPISNEPEITERAVNPTERRVSSTGYEEIPPSEGNSEPSQDLSPIYEEIKGGSRSTVSTSSGQSSSNSSNANQQAQSADLCPRGKFFFSLYDFDGSQSTMLSVKRGQVVRVIQVTTGGDWWFVENRNAQRGYVPKSFLKEYPKEQLNKS